MEKCRHNVSYGTKYDKFNCSYCIQFPAFIQPTGPTGFTGPTGSTGPTGPTQTS